ncbi:MAG: MFS transporter [Bacilli bacterium]
MNDVKKIELSNKIHPYLFGLSDDLLFWAALNTVFLTTVKNFNASQISMLSAIAVFSSIIFQGLVFKVIKKLGNIKSVRFGLFLLVLAASIITFFKNFYIVAIGEIIYHLAFFFTNMGNVILKRNLKFINREKDFTKIQSKGSLIYSLVTMFISFIAGFIFNINEYLPMIICILMCIFNIFLSKNIYECKLNEIENLKISEKAKRKVNWNKIIILIIISYGLLYATVETLQENGKIFIQYDLQNYVTINQVSIYLTIVIAVSRISRVLSNIFFDKIYNKLKSSFIILLNFLVFLSTFLMIIGSCLTYNVIGTIIMAIGFCILLFTRDPIMIFTKTELFNNCDEHDQEIVMHKFNLSRKIVRCFFATLVSFLLTKFEMIYIMILLFVFCTIYIVLIINLYINLKKIENNIKNA